MKIVSFVRTKVASSEHSGEEHGILTRDGLQIVSFGSLPSMAGIACDQCLTRVLVADSETREAWVEEANAAAGSHGLPMDSVRLLPSVPRCPLFVVLHGNSPMIWKRQGPRAQRWQVTRIPYPRIRPWSCLSGHDAEIALPPGTRLNHGAEMGIVIGKPAHRVAEDDAIKHIAGITVTNDGYHIGLHDEFILPSPDKLTPLQRQAMDTLYKCADGCGMMGPWITTLDETGDHFDLLLNTYKDGQRQNRAWSGSYLLTPEFLISYFSRFMTLPTGTVISIGAAGWDGSVGVPMEDLNATASLEVEIERVGKLRTVARRVTSVTESPLLKHRKDAGLPPARPSDVGPALWVLRAAYRGCDAVEGADPEAGMSPNLYPSLALQADARKPLRLPPHATSIHCSVQLAAIIGPNPVYRCSPVDAAKAIRGYAVMLGVRDGSLSEPLRNPTAYELRGAFFLGCCGDGFFRLGPLHAPGELPDLRSVELTLDADELGRIEYDAADYRFALEQMVAMVSRATTLLPGDVLSLGPLGREIVLPADRPAPKALTLWLDSRMELKVDVLDERDPKARDMEVR